MAEDVRILEQIGRWLQRAKTDKKKKSVARGLESKIKTTKPLTNREQLLLDTQLKASSIIESMKGEDFPKNRGGLESYKESLLKY